MDATETTDRATNHSGSNGTVSKLSRLAETFIAVVTESETEEERTRPQPRRQSHLKSNTIGKNIAFLTNVFLILAQGIRG